MAYSYYHPTYQMYVHIGDGSDDVIQGTDQADYILTYGGDDVINANDGDDRIYSGSGDDFIDSGAGNDSIDGGAGTDTVVVEGSIGSYSISGTVSNFVNGVNVTQTSGTDRLVNVEALQFDDYTLYLDGRNNAAYAMADELSAVAGSISVIDAEKLLANDREFDGDKLSFGGVASKSESGASVTLEDGLIIYDAGTIFAALAGGETATDSFDYKVDDGLGGTAVGTVEVTITGVNDAPILDDASFTIDEGLAVGSVVGQLTGSDAEGDTLLGFEFLTGNLDLDGDGILAFAVDDSGEITVADADDLDFETQPDFALSAVATDGEATSEAATVNISLNDVAEGPFARINEFHYDNAGRDRDEFIELRVEEGADVSGLAVELYNGSNNSLYRRFEIADAVQMADDGDNAYDYFVFELRPNHIQNGYRDGIALVDGDDLLEFISYEGVLTAANGIAAGETSVDVGVLESYATLHGTSIQRSEDGSEWFAGLAVSTGIENSFDFV